MDVQKKTYTTEEFFKIAALPENRDRLLELIDGEIVEKVGSFKPSNIALWISTFLNMYILETNSGYATGADGGYHMPDGSILIPDVAFISKSRLPEAPEREVPVPPDLAVEVKSPNDTKRELRQKAERYLKAGTPLVWLVFPEDQVVEVYVPDQDVSTKKIDETLDGGSVLPGFTLPVRNIFRD